MKGSHVFTRLGHWSYRRRTMILVGSALVIIVTAIVGLSVFPRLGSEGFNDPASDSEQVAQILEEQFDSPESNMVIALIGPESDGPDSVDSDESTRTGTELAEAVASVPGVPRTSISELLTLMLALSRIFSHYPMWPGPDNVPLLPHHRRETCPICGL